LDFKLCLNGIIMVDKGAIQSYNLGYLNGRLIFTKKANANFSYRFKQRIINIFKFFPELQDEVIYVGWIAPRGWARGSCCISSSSTSSSSSSTASANKKMKISLQPNERNFTIAHEFTHLLQARKKEDLQIPSGERACDVWTLTRLPLEFLDDYPTYIGSYLMRKRWDIIKPQVRELAFSAIEIRRTKRQYIAWLEAEIKKL
jgi:hypothetical protein